MKKYIVFLLLAPCFSFAQLIPEMPSNSDGNLYFAQVVQADSLSAQSLFSNVRVFIADHFRSANNIIATKSNSTTSIFPTIF